MSEGRRKKKRRSVDTYYEDPELLIMPFIDVFGLLTTYLLFSAVFVSIGIHDVQIPFFTNAPPDDSKPKRAISVKVDVEKDKIQVITSWSPPPEDEQISEYTNTEEGIAEMHAQLMEIRMENPDTDLLNLFVQDEVEWENLSNILDGIKLRWDGDPEIPSTEDTPNRNMEALYPKVVMSSVIL